MSLSARQPALTLPMLGAVSNGDISIPGDPKKAGGRAVGVTQDRGTFYDASMRQITATPANPVGATPDRGTFYDASMSAVQTAAPSLIGGPGRPVGATQDRGTFYDASVQAASRRPPEPLGPALVPVAGVPSPTFAAVTRGASAAAPAGRPVGATQDRGAFYGASMQQITASPATPVGVTPDRGTFYDASMGAVPAPAPAAPALIGGPGRPVGATQDRAAFYDASMQAAQKRPPEPLGPALVPVAGTPSPTFTPPPRYGEPPAAAAPVAPAPAGASRRPPEPLGPALVPVAGAASPTFTPPAKTPAKAPAAAPTAAPPAAPPAGTETAPPASFAARSAVNDAETRAALDTSGIRPAYRGETAGGVSRLTLPTATLGGGKAELSAPAGSPGAQRLEQMAGTQFAAGAPEYETDAQVAARRPDLYGPDGKPRQADAYGNAIDSTLAPQVEQMKRITASIREMNGLPPEGAGGRAGGSGENARAAALFAQADEIAQQAAGVGGQIGDRRRREQMLQQAADLRATATRLQGLSVEQATAADRNAIERERNQIAAASARHQGDPRQQFLTLKGADGSEQAVDLRTMQPLRLPGATGAAGGMTSNDRAFMNDIAKFAKDASGGSDAMEMDEATRARYQTIAGAAQQLYAANRGGPNAGVLTPSVAVQIAAGLADGSLRPIAGTMNGRTVRVVEFNGGVWPLDPIE